MPEIKKKDYKLPFIPELLLNYTLNRTYDALAPIFEKHKTELDYTGNPTEIGDKVDFHGEAIILNKALTVLMDLNNDLDLIENGIIRESRLWGISNKLGNIVADHLIKNKASWDYFVVRLLKTKIYKNKILLFGIYTGEHG